MQAESYTGPITLKQYERLQHVREVLKKEGSEMPMQGGDQCRVAEVLNERRFLP